MAANHNHPKEGSILFVEPLRTTVEVMLVKDYLKRRPRDYALFVVGVNTAFRASDLLSLTAGEVRRLSGTDLLKREQKTGKMRRVTLNNSALSVLQPLIEGKADDDLVFPSSKTKDKITVAALNAMVKRWCRHCGLTGNFGSHTLRKTWGNIQRTVYGVEWDWLRLAYGHTSILTTQRYLGIQPEEIERIYMNEV